MQGQLRRRAYDPELRESQLLRCNIRLDNDVVQFIEARND
jgi:hypothetical protein